MRKHWHLLTDIPGCENAPLIDLRKMRSLQNILVKSTNNKKEVGTSSFPRSHFRCGRCTFCPLMANTKQICFPDVNLKFDSSSFSNYNTSFVTYLVECPCLQRYVGSTQRPLCVTIQEHVSRIRNKVLEAPLVQHYLSNNHSPNDLKVYVLEVIESEPSKNRIQRLLQREVFWITRLNTLHPNGLNSDLNFGVF